MTTTGTSAAKIADEIDLALIPHTGGRTPFARQLDLFYRLGVRMVLAGSIAQDIIQRSSERRRQLETVLTIPHAMWVNLGRNALRIQSVAAHATVKLAPDLKNVKQVDDVFSELAQLLSDTDRYYERLDELEWSERYQPIGRTFQPQDALISHDASTWVFLYDRTGRWLKPESELQRVGYGGADWKRNTAFIWHVESTIRELMPDTVDALTALSTELRILPTAPPWTATRPALERLEGYRATRKPYAGVEDDIKSVGEYAKMLAANQHELDLALTCGAVAGRLGPAAPGGSVTIGLRAVSDVYGFADPTRPGAMVERQLEDLAGVIETRWPALSEPFTKLKTYVKQQKHDEWSAALRECVSLISKSVTFSDADRQAAVQKAWDAWRPFLVSGRTGPFAPGFDSVLCRVAGIGPYSVFRKPLGEMSLADWSDAYFRALVHPSMSDKEFAPAWLGPIAAVTLAPLPSGTVKFDVAAMFPKALTPNEIQVLEQKAAAPPPSRLSGLIVHTGTPFVRDWRGAGEYAAVSWGAKQASEALTVLKASGRAGPLWTPIDHVFIETGVNDQDARAVIDLLNRFPRAAHKLKVIAFSLSRNAPTPSWAERLVAQPENAAALLRTAEALRITEPDKLPPALKSLWENGARLTGTLVLSGAETNLSVEFTPQPTDVKIAWEVENRRGLGWLSLAGTLDARTGIIVRRYGIDYDGVTVRAEQEGAYVLGLNNFLGQVLANWFVDALSFEFKADTNGWTGELTRRPARARNTERRTQIRLFAARVTVASSSAPAP